MSAANYEPEMRIDKLADRCERLERALLAANKALQYCAIQPLCLPSLANSQQAVAQNAIAEIREILESK